MTRVKGVKNPLILKETLKKIQDVLNDYEEWQIDNGDAWGYVLKLNPNKDIELRIYDEIECESCNYSVAIPNENITGIKDILKGLVNEIYEKEINWRNSCLRSNKGFYSRKHKSICTWTERENLQKILQITNQIADRYKNSKLLERDIEHFKVFVSRLYYALNCLDKSWKIEDIKEAAIKRCDELNIKNVGISHINSRLIVMKNNNDATAVLDKFDIEIDSYSNVNMIVNQIVSRLRKVA